MSDEVDICNAALIKLGANTITSLTENSPAARRCATVYPQQRDLLLRGHFWNFATKRKTLAQLSATPDFEYDFQYQLPTDFIRVLEIYNYPTAKFKIEEDRLLTDLSSVQLVYIRKVTDPNKFDPSFTQALAGALAVELSYSLAASPTLAQIVQRQAKDLLRKAKTIDSQEGSPINTRATSWIDAGKNPAWSDD